MPKLSTSVDILSVKEIRDVKSDLVTNHIKNSVVDLFIHATLEVQTVLKIAFVSNIQGVQKSCGMFLRELSGIVAEYCS